jgi:hypothetical protein
LAHYLVTAQPRENLLCGLRRRLEAGEFEPLRPFGKEVTRALKDARRRPDGSAVWEEEDYCTPPLAQERAAALDLYFDGIEVEPVEQGAGWQRIMALPGLFESLA